MSEEWLSLSDVAQMLGVHSSTVRNWADQGRLPVYRTQGGHRRFRRSEVELCLGTQNNNGSQQLDLLVQNALKHTRLQISEGHLHSEEWYQKLDEEAREQYRRSGRALLAGLIISLSPEESSAETEARALGYEYASRAQRSGLGCTEAVHAFLFFRNALFESMLTVYETASVHSPRAWGEMLRKVNTFMDQIMVTLLETYLAYQRNNR